MVKVKIIKDNKQNDYSEYVNDGFIYEAFIDYENNMYCVNFYKEIMFIDKDCVEEIEDTLEDNKSAKIEVTDTLVFEYNLLGNDEKEQKYFYELRQIIHKKVKNIEKVKSSLEIRKENDDE